MSAIPWAAWVRVVLVYFLCVGLAGAIGGLINAYLGLAAFAVMLVITAKVLGPTVRPRA